MKREKPKTCECGECTRGHEPCGAPATNAKDRNFAMCAECAGPRRTWAKYDTGSELDKLWDITCAKRDRPKKLERSRTGTVLLFAVGRRCAAHWPLDEAFDPRLVEKRCTLPCEADGCTSPHPRPCFCATCAPSKPRREWRPAW